MLFDVTSVWQVDRLRNEDSSYFGTAIGQTGVAKDPVIKFSKWS